MFDQTPYDRVGFTFRGCVFKMALYPILRWADEVNDASIMPYEYEDDTSEDLYNEMFNRMYLCALVIYIHVYLLLQASTQRHGNLLRLPSWTAYLEACWSECAEPYVNA